MAIKPAEALDKRIASGDVLKGLEGVPIAHKDVFVTKGVQTTAASKILQGYVPDYDATVVERLDQNGAILLGKTNCDEFAQGTTGENSAFGPTLNPYDPTRVAGGTSSGSAVAVASKMCLLATGSDTGGSVRLPASFCGVYGLKPTYGRLSRYGLISVASSFDCPGLLTRHLEDLVLTFNQVKGKDVKDASSLDYQDEMGNGKLEGGKLRVGLPKEFMEEGVDSEIKEAVMLQAKKLEQAGLSVQEVSLPHSKYSLAAYYIINFSEISSNLARYDGIRYGQKSDEKVGSYDELITKVRSQFLGDEVKRRIILGTFSLSAGYYEAFYKKAMSVRELIKKDFEEVFKVVDVLISPVSPHLPPLLGEMVNDPLKMYAEDILTVPASLVGVPVLSVPSSTSKSGLPIGTQLMAPWGREDILFKVARGFGM